MTMIAVICIGDHDRMAKNRLTDALKKALRAKPGANTENDKRVTA